MTCIWACAQPGKFAHLTSYELAPVERSSLFVSVMIVSYTTWAFQHGNDGKARLQCPQTPSGLWTICWLFPGAFTGSQFKLDIYNCIT